jgi:hypothetical protein
VVVISDYSSELVCNFFSASISFNFFSCSIANYISFLRSRASFAPFFNLSPSSILSMASSNFFYFKRANDLRRSALKHKSKKILFIYMYLCSVYNNYHIYIYIFIPLLFSYPFSKHSQYSSILSQSTSERWGGGKR